jgi:hypothetical protein
MGAGFIKGRCYICRLSSVVYTCNIDIVYVCTIYASLISTDELEKIRSSKYSGLPVSYIYKTRVTIFGKIKYIHCLLIDLHVYHE